MKVIFFALVLIAALCCQPGCTEFEKEVQEKTVQDYPDQESWNNNIYFQRDGKRLAVLTAGYIAKYNEKKHTILKEFQDHLHPQYFVESFLNCLNTQNHFVE